MKTPVPTRKATRRAAHSRDMKSSTYDLRRRIAPRPPSAAIKSRPAAGRGTAAGFVTPRSSTRTFPGLPETLSKETYLMSMNDDSAEVFTVCPPSLLPFDAAAKDRETLSVVTVRAALSPSNWYQKLVREKTPLFSSVILGSSFLFIAKQGARPGGQFPFTIRKPLPTRPNPSATLFLSDPPSPSKPTVDADAATPLNAKAAKTAAAYFVFANTILTFRTILQPPRLRFFQNITPRFCVKANCGKLLP